MPLASLQHCLSDAACEKQNFCLEVISEVRHVPFPLLFLAFHPFPLLENLKEPPPLQLFPRPFALPNLLFCGLQSEERNEYEGSGKPLPVFAEIISAYRKDLYDRIFAVAVALAISSFVKSTLSWAVLPGMLPSLRSCSVL